MEEKIKGYPTGGRYRLFQVAVLSLSLILASIGVGGVLLGDLAQEFPDASITKLQMFISFPTIGGIVANIVGGQLAGKMGKKNLCLLGIGCATIGGFGAMFMPTLELKIAIRIIAAFGVGMVQPLSASLIVDCFEGKVANTMMGIQSSMVGAGATLHAATMTAIMSYDWHYAYCAHLYGVGIFLLVLFGIPAFVNQLGREEKRPQAEGTVKTEKKKLPYTSILGAGCGFIYNLGWGVLSGCLALAAVETGTITTVQAAAVTSAGSIAALIGGFIFGPIKNKIGFNVGWLALAVCGTGLLIIGLTDTLPMWYLGACVGQLGFCWWMPYANFLVNDGTDPSNSAVATSLGFAGGSIGGFVFPYVLAAVGGAIGGITQHHAFIYGAILVYAVMIIIAINHFTHLSHYREIGKVD